MELVISYLVYRNLVYRLGSEAILRYICCYFFHSQFLSKSVVQNPGNHNLIVKFSKFSRECMPADMQIDFISVKNTRHFRSISVSSFAQNNLSHLPSPQNICSYALYDRVRPDGNLTCKTNFMPYVLKFQSTTFG